MKRNMTISDFYCTECGRKGLPVQRKMGREREPGHLKNLYCLYCGKNVNMVEIKPFGTKYTLKDFEDEFRYGNFKDGKRVLSLGDFKQMRNTMEKQNNG